MKKMGVQVQKPILILSFQKESKKNYELVPLHKVVENYEGKDVSTTLLIEHAR